MKGSKKHITAEEIIFRNTITMKAIVNVLESKGVLKAEDVNKEINKMDREFDMDARKL